MVNLYLLCLISSSWLSVACVCCVSHISKCKPQISKGKRSEWVQIYCTLKVLVKNYGIILRSHKIRPAFYTERTFCILICKYKDWVATEDENNIAYENDCSNCKAVYFSESKWSLKSCSGEHKMVFWDWLHHSIRFFY